MRARIAKLNAAFERAGPYGKATFAAGVFFAVFAAGYLAGCAPPRDAFGYLIGRDFVNDWMGARAALEGRFDRLFDAAAYAAALREVFGPLPPQNWSYPPHLLLFLWPLGLMPYLPALALWSVGGWATYLKTAMGHGGFWFLVLAPAVAINLVTGQNGFFSAALLIGAVSLIDRRPVVAGLCLGLLSLKPQLVLLFPLALALRGRWRVLFVASATALALAGLAAAIWGIGVWRDYFDLVVPFQQQVMTEGGGLSTLMMPTGFMNARLLGASADIAWLVQAPFTLAALAAVVWAFARRRDPVLSSAVLVTAGFVFTPYAFDYDMVVFGWLILRLRPQLSGVWDTRLMLAVWALPVLTIVFGLLHLPLSAPIMAAFMGLLVYRLKEKAPPARPEGLDAAV